MYIILIIRKFCFLKFKPGYLKGVINPKNYNYRGMFCYYICLCSMKKLLPG